MKILHLINSLATGGAEQIVVQLADEGTKRGHDVRILTLNYQDGNPHRKALSLDVPVTSIKSAPSPLSIEREVLKAAESADLLHVHLFPSLYYGVRFDGPKIFTEHNTTNRRRNKPLFSPFEKWAYESYDVLVGVSEGVSRGLSRHLSDIKLKDKRIETIHNGVPEFFFRPLERARGSYTRLVIVGSLTKQKNHSLALRVLSLLPEMTLDVAGTGPLCAQIRREARSLKIENRVNFLGNVRDVISLLTESDILLSTSTFEGFGLAVLEAQATGIPVVAPRVEGIDEVVDDGVSGFLFDEPDPQKIAQKVSEASKPTKYRELSAGARSKAASFSMGKCLDRYLGLYRELTQ